MPTQLTHIALAKQAPVAGFGRHLRERAGLSLPEAGYVSGFAPQQLSRYERGLQRPTGKRAARYGKFLAELLELVGTESSTDSQETA